MLAPQLLAKVQVGGVGVHFFHPPPPLGIVKIAVDAALFEELMSQIEVELVEDAAGRFMVDAQMVHHPLLRAIVPFCASGQAGSVAQQAVVPAVICGGGIMESVGEIPGFVGLESHLLQHVGLGVAGRPLHQWVVIGQHAILSVDALYVLRPQVFLWPVAAHAQVAVAVVGNAGHQRPSFPADVGVGVAGELLIGGSVAGGAFAFDECFFSERQLRSKCIEAHHAADGVAAVYDRTRAEKHLGAFGSEGVQRDHVLQVAAAEDGRIHAHPVYGNQQAVGGETADHRAAAALLAFLDEYLS